MIALKIFAVLSLVFAVWQFRCAWRNSRRFQCPSCGRRYSDYYAGHDCACGTIHLCGRCYYGEHASHDTFTDWDAAILQSDDNAKLPTKGKAS
jgi:hypothetical protein